LTGLKLNGLSSLIEDQKNDKFDELMSQIDANFSPNCSPSHKKSILKATRELSVPTNIISPTHLSITNINLTLEEKTCKLEAEPFSMNSSSPEKIISLKRSKKLGLLPLSFYRIIFR